MPNDLLTALLMGRQGKLTGGPEAKVSAPPEPSWPRKVLETLTGYPASADTELGPADVAMAALPAWHGSGALFKKFKYIPGIGSDTFGPGIYTDLRKMIGEGYQPKTSVMFKDFDMLGRHHYLNRALDEAAYETKSASPSALRAYLEQRAKKISPHDQYALPENSIAVAAGQAADMLKQKAPLTVKPGGYLYKIDLDIDPDKTLRLMQPMVEQPKFVKEALADVPGSDWPNTTGLDVIDNMMQSTRHLDRDARRVSLVNEMAKRKIHGSTPGKKPFGSPDNYIIYDPELIDIKDIFNDFGKRIKP